MWRAGRGSQLRPCPGKDPTGLCPCCCRAGAMLSAPALFCVSVRGSVKFQFSRPSLASKSACANPRGAPSYIRYIYLDSFHPMPHFCAENGLHIPSLLCHTTQALAKPIQMLQSIMSVTCFSFTNHFPDSKCIILMKTG